MSIKRFPKRIRINTCLTAARCNGSEVRQTAAALLFRMYYVFISLIKNSSRPYPIDACIFMTPQRKNIFLFLTITLSKRLAIPGL